MMPSKMSWAWSSMRAVASASSQTFGVRILSASSSLTSWSKKWWETMALAASTASVSSCISIPNPSSRRTFGMSRIGSTTMSARMCSQR